MIAYKFCPVIGCRCVFDHELNKPKTYHGDNKCIQDGLRVWNWCLVFKLNSVCHNFESMVKQLMCYPFFGAGKIGCYSTDSWPRGNYCNRNLK